MSDVSVPTSVKTVYILIGASGSGKTTWVDERRKPTSRVVSADFCFHDDRTGSYNFSAKKLPEAHGQCLRDFIRYVSDNHALAPPYLLANPAPGSIVDEVFVDNTNTSVAEIAPYYAATKAYCLYSEVVLVRFHGEFKNKHGVPDHIVEAQRERVGRLLETLPPFWDYSVRDVVW